MTIDGGMAPGVPGAWVDEGGGSPPVPDDEWRVIRAELGQRRVVALRRKLVAGGIDVGRLEEVLSPSSRIDDAEATTRELVGFLLPIWNSLASRPADGVLLAVFLYARCHAVWELSGDEERVAVGVRILRQSWERATVPADAAARLTVDLVVAHAQSLVACTQVENALRCSCPVALRAQADLVVAECGRLLSRSAELSAEWAGFRAEFLVPVLRTHQLAYHGLREAAESVTEWAVRGRAAAPALRRAMTVLERAERDPDVALDVYANELRGHHAGLAALHARITDPDVPEVRIARAKIVYCYPFSIPGLDGAEVCRRAGELAPDDFGPGRGCAVAETELSDIWDAQGKQQAEYGGTTVVLPGLTVWTTSGDAVDGHAVSIRLSRLGNHYIRIEKSISGYTVHELNQAMRRAAPYMGLELVTEDGGATGSWRQFAEYVRDLAVQFRGLVWPENATAEGDSPVALVTDADFHVLVEITSAIVTNDDGTTGPATTADILTAVGPLLCAPLQRLPSTLEEWVRFSTSSAGDSRLPANLVDSIFAFPRDFVGRSLDSTFIVMLETPNWALLEYEERAEFVASLPPLIEGWRNELVEAIEAEQADKLQLLGSTELAARRMALQDRVRRIQGQVALLHSIDLWKTLSGRRFGESMYTAAGLDDVEAELAQTITRVELYYERLAALISQHEERRDRRYQTLVELVLAVLAVSSLADVFSLINQLFGYQGQGIARWEIGSLLVTVTVVVMLMIGMVYKRRD